MSNFRAKLNVQSVLRGEGAWEEVTFFAQYSNNPEDNSFSKATPSAQLKMTITNPQLVGTINPGDKYYLDFSLIKPEATV